MPLSAYMAELEPLAEVGDTVLFKYSVIKNRTYDNKSRIKFGQHAELRCVSGFYGTGCAEVVERWRGYGRFSEDVGCRPAIERDRSARISAGHHERLLAGVQEPSNLRLDDNPCSLLSLGDLIRSQSLIRRPSGLSEGDEDEAEPEDPNRHSDKGRYAHRPGPNGDGALGLKIAFIALSAAGVLFNLCAALFNRKAVDGTLELTAFAGGVCLILGCFFGSDLIRSID